MATKKKVIVPVTAEMKAMLRATTSEDLVVAHKARIELAAALRTPLKQGVLPGNTITGIFEEQQFDAGTHVEFPLDFVAPGAEGNFIAFTVPNTGRIPEMHIEGDFLSVPTYDIATSIDWARKYARDARWDVVGRAMRTAGAAMQRKKNDDGWRTIVTAGANRNIGIYDNEAASGLFTKRLIALAETVMRRNAGGNSNSVDRGKLTHVAISPEGLQDVRSWDLTQIDDVTRREIFLANGDYAMTRIFGVTLIDLDELGVNQSYQKYFQNTLAATIPGSKAELAIGLDLSTNDSFFMPYRLSPSGDRVEMQQRVTLIEQNRDGFYWREEVGFAVLDSRRVILLGF